MERQFNSADVFKILRHKFVVIIGDSVHRSIYKDLVLLIQRDRFLTTSELRSKGERSFIDDELLEGGVKDGLTNGTSYKEVRQYKKEHHHLKFYFVTRCYNSYVKTILLDLQEEPTPDIILMNSGLWDISRYGKDSMSEYQENLLNLFHDFHELMPRDCLLIWNTTMPVSKNARGGFLPPAEEEFRQSVLAADIKEANMFATYAADLFNIRILDLYARLCDHIELQVQDGIHWDMIAHRFITNLILEIVVGYFGLGTRVPFRPSEFLPRYHQNMNLNFVPIALQMQSTIANTISNSLQLVAAHAGYGHLPPHLSYGPQFGNENLMPRQMPDESPVCRPHRLQRRQHRINRPYFNSPNSSQNSSGFQSPLSDQSFDGYHQSPIAFNTPNSQFPNTFDFQNFFDSTPSSDSPHYTSFDNPSPNNNSFDYPSPNVVETPRDSFRFGILQPPNVNYPPHRAGGARSSRHYPGPYPSRPKSDHGRNGLYNLGSYEQQNDMSSCKVRTERRSKIGAARPYTRRRNSPYNGI